MTHLCFLSLLDFLLSLDLEPVWGDVPSSSIFLISAAQYALKSEAWLCFMHQPVTLQPSQSQGNTLLCCATKTKKKPTTLRKVESVLELKQQKSQQTSVISVLQLHNCKTYSVISEELRWNWCSFCHSNHLLWSAMLGGNYSLSAFVKYPVFVSVLVLTGLDSQVSGSGKPTDLPFYRVHSHFHQVLEMVRSHRPHLKDVLIWPEFTPWSSPLGSSKTGSL